MPVEFRMDDEAAAYGPYAGAPSQADMERVFFLDDEDRKLVDLRRGDHTKAGFATPPGPRRRTSGCRLPRRAGSPSRSPADRFMGVYHPPGRVQQPVKRGSPFWASGGRPVSQALTYETA
jgi:hypothetical protein